MAKFNGLATRYNHLIDPETGLAPANAANIIDAGGTGTDNTSIYIVQWGSDRTHLIYPQGTKAGLHIEDKGQVTLEDENRGRYEGLRSYFQWDVGLTVRDIGVQLFALRILMFPTFLKMHQLVRIWLIF
ncbi:major capsid protein [Acinetobacter nosocomialis]|uniref:major capsid protein n=1 Tax=Acinetobacter nosocomialis TaxID=106654 RepID=UPI0031F44463